jgi:hypothetical protein
MLKHNLFCSQQRMGTVLLTLYSSMGFLINGVEGEQFGSNIILFNGHLP